MKTTCILLGLLLPSAIAVPTLAHKIHEQRDSLNSRWAKGKLAHADTRVPVRIALKQSNIDKAEAYLLEVYMPCVCIYETASMADLLHSSDPRSPKYGQHYTADQVMGLFAPSEEDINTVKDWLMTSGIPADSIALSNSKGWLQFETSSSQLESILKTRFYEYSNDKGKTAYFGSDEYSLPAYISPLVDLVLPGITFLEMRKTTVRRLPLTPLGRDSFIKSKSDPSMPTPTLQELSGKCLTPWKQ